ncbi:MAG: shikimate kinase [Candidatus Zixiibacteriota bacterium]
MNRASACSLFLVGFSGSGKTTVGKMLAHRCKIPFIDTDTQIARRAGKSIKDIFAEHGESYFRKLESTVIRDLTTSKVRKIVALGGGAYQNRVNRQLIDRAGIIIYLSCSVRELYRRLSRHTDRPLLRAAQKGGSEPRHVQMHRIKKLLSTRIHAYHMANIRVSTTGKTVKEIVVQIERKLKALDAARSGQA